MLKWADTHLTFLWKKNRNCIVFTQATEKQAKLSLILFKQWNCYN